MSRDVPYDPDEVCEICGDEGCFLFPDGSLCVKCFTEEDNDEEKHRSAH